VTQPASSGTRELETVESPSHVVLGLVAALMALVMGGIGYMSHTGPSGVPAAAGDHPNPVAATTK